MASGPSQPASRLPGMGRHSGRGSTASPLSSTGLSSVVAMRGSIARRADRMEFMGRLVLCGAPIGNVADASRRLYDTLATADLVAAEDTRRLLRLARDLDV